MGVLDIKVELRLHGSPKPFVTLDLDEATIKDLSKIAPVLEDIKKLGKLFGLG